MKKILTILLLTGISLMARGERITIDFNQSNWKIKLKEIDYENTQELELVNLNSNIILPKDLKFQSLRDIYFKESKINKLPTFLSELELNLISFYQTVFQNEEINSSIINTAKRISINGDKTKHLPSDILKFNGLEYIFITKTSVEQINIPNQYLTVLKELTIQANEQLTEIMGEIGNQESLQYLDLFGSPLLKTFKIAENNKITKLRIGSWTEESPVFQEFEKLICLNEVIIDNYRSQIIDISFLNNQNVEKLKISCPDNLNIKTITSLVKLKHLNISRQIKCRETTLVFNELSNLPELQYLQINLGGNTSKEEFEEFIEKFDKLERVKLIDTYWDEYGETNLKGVEVYINN